MEIDILTGAAESYTAHIKSEEMKDVAYQAFMQGALWQRWRNPTKTPAPPTDNNKLSKEHAAEVHNR